MSHPRPTFVNQFTKDGPEILYSPDREMFLATSVDTGYIFCRAVDPHSFFADPNPDVFLNADPDLALQNGGVYF